MLRQVARIYSESNDIRRKVDAFKSGIERDDGILGTRMREVKEDELKRCLADVLYTCVVKNLGDYNVSLTPSVYKFQLNV